MNSSNNEISITIYQSFKLNHPIDWSQVEWQTYLISILIILSCLTILRLWKDINQYHPDTQNRNKRKYKKINQNQPEIELTISSSSSSASSSSIPSLPLQSTATESFCEMFNYNHDLIDLTLIEFCGIKHPKINDKLQEIMRLKIKFKQKKRGLSKTRLMLLNIIMMILICSLLFAAYTGIIFLHQNDKNRKQYSTPFSCQWVEDENLCFIEDDYYSLYDGYYPRNYHFDLKKKENFYNDVLVPYLVKHDENIMNEHQYITLSISPNTQNPNDWIYSINSNGTQIHQIDGYLYLSPNGLNDSDFKMVDHEPLCFCCDGYSKTGNCYCGDCWCELDHCWCHYCCSCDCVCYSCAECWVGWAIIFVLIFLFCCMDIWLIEGFTSLILKDLNRIIQEINNIDQEGW